MPRPILVVVLLRGGVDALNAVVPYGDADYDRWRSTLKIPAPGKARRAAVDLDGFYGIHPALAPLLPLWHRGELAVVHAVGWPGVSHSHFEAWEEIECGAVGDDRPSSGWLARSLAASASAKAGSALRAVGFAETMPRLLGGAVGATAMQTLEDYRLAAEIGRREGLERGLRLLYGQGRGEGPIEKAGLATLDALSTIGRLLARRPISPERQGSGFRRQLAMVHRLIQADVGMEAASVELSGWDFHFSEGAIEGPMANLLSDLAQGLSEFARDLGSDWKRVAVVAISEFGRRVEENGSGGTDHGQAGLVLVAGGAVAGGRVLGEWPGLAPSRLAGPGDVAITTDFRDVLLELLPASLSSQERDRVFPRYSKKRELGLLTS